MSRVGDTWLQGWLAALGLHAALLAWLFLAPPRLASPPRRPPTRVRLVAPSPPATPAPVPATPDRPPPRQRLPERRTELVRPATPPPPLAPPPLLEAPPAAPAPAPAAPRRFAASLEATVPGGGVAVPTAQPGAAPVVRGVPGGAADGVDPALAGEPDAGPVLLGQPSTAEMRSLYPEAARRSGIEGDVKLELLVSETGEVLEVKVLRPAGNGFDEVAERLVRRFRFRPAIRGGRPVPARVPWTYKFRLEG